MSDQERHIADIQDAARSLAHGRIDDAVDILTGLIDDFPGYVAAHVLLAQAHEANRQPEEALSAWHTAHLLMPGSPLIARRRAARLTESLAPPTAEFVLPDDFFYSPAEPAQEDWSDEPDIVLDAVQSPEKPETTVPNVNWVDIDEITATEDIQPSEEPGAGMTPAEVESEDVVTEDAGAFDGIGDLDDLISSLENAPPIRPGSIDPEDVDEPDIPEVVSETLARIYETQKQYGFAAQVYEKLAEELPHRSGEFRKKAAALRTRSEES